MQSVKAVRGVAFTFFNLYIVLYKISNTELVVGSVVSIDG